ncbi:hypothetical protein FQN60_002886 [Etheostoma spectabile]|uniref:Uncharacterized protein n=1 Tax=Etheostoma spectabile TaxID=54343 RepID=A0A5J5CKA7_9PERO|nr:hypothetical protein FQN60_002886 [Etheostoma spectabile]
MFNLPPDAPVDKKGSRLDHNDFRRELQATCYITFMKQTVGVGTQSEKIRQKGALFEEPRSKMVPPLRALEQPPHQWCHGRLSPSALSLVGSRCYINPPPARWCVSQKLFLLCSKGRAKPVELPETAGVGRRHHLGAVMPQKHKEPHSESSGAVSHTHTVKRTPRPIQHTAWNYNNIFGYPRDSGGPHNMCKVRVELSWTEMESAEISEADREAPVSLVLALDGSCKSERRLDEIQRENAHVSVETVLGDLQGPAAGARHQLLLLQNEDVVGFLAGLGGVKATCSVFTSSPYTSSLSCLKDTMDLWAAGMEDLMMWLKFFPWASASTAHGRYSPGRTSEQRLRPSLREKIFDASQERMSPPSHSVTRLNCSR